MTKIYLMRKYKVVRCPKCRTIQVTSAIRLKCKYCGKSTIVKSGKTAGFNLKIFNSFNEAEHAGEFSRKLKEEIAKNKGVW